MRLDVHGALDALIPDPKKGVHQQLRLGRHLGLHRLNVGDTRQRQPENVRWVRLQQPLNPLIHLRHDNALPSAPSRVPWRAVYQAGGSVASAGLPASEQPRNGAGGFGRHYGPVARLGVRRAPSNRL